MDEELRKRMVAFMEKRGPDSHIALLLRALELCNESRDRLTIFTRPVRGWIEEAIAESERP